MATKRPVADDAYWVLDTLVVILNDAYAVYTQDENDFSSRYYLWSAGLHADKIEREYHRAARNKPTWVSASRFWSRLPEILGVGRRLVAEFQERERQRVKAGTA